MHAVSAVVCGIERGIVATAMARDSNRRISHGMRVRDLGDPIAELHLAC